MVDTQAQGLALDVGHSGDPGEERQGAFNEME
jgi:hypothetical protein